MEAITVVEFKRPLTSGGSDQKNPVDQVLEYVELIREGQATSRSGRALRAKHAYFFGYVVGELDDPLRRLLSRRTMQETPDGRGMFFAQHRLYLAVISYEKMLDDAMRRSRMLFEKLQIPAQECR